MGEDLRRRTVLRDDAAHLDAVAGCGGDRIRGPRGRPARVPATDEETAGAAGLLKPVPVPHAAVFSRIEHCYVACHASVVTGRVRDPAADQR